MMSSLSEPTRDQSSWMVSSSGVAVVRYVFFMAQIAWEDGLEMRIPEEEGSFVG